MPMASARRPRAAAEGRVAGKDQGEQHDHHPGKQQDDSDQPRHGLLSRCRLLGELVVHLGLGLTERRPNRPPLRLDIRGLAGRGGRRWGRLPRCRVHLGLVRPIEPWDIGASRLDFPLRAGDRGRRDGGFGEMTVLVFGRLRLGVRGCEAGRGGGNRIGPRA